MRRKSRRGPAVEPKLGAASPEVPRAAPSPRRARSARAHLPSSQVQRTLAQAHPASTQVLHSRPGAPSADLEPRIGYRFRSPALLERALTHASAAREQGSEVVESQRLEFLGDAVLGFLIGEMIYHRGPSLAEGPMSRLRAALVQEATLAERARAVGLPSAIRLGKGEDRSGGRGKPSIQADTYEALLAAIYLDGGMDAARTWVERQFAPLLEHQIGLGPEGPIVIEPSRKRVGRSKSRTGRAEDQPGRAGGRAGRAGGRPGKTEGKPGKTEGKPGKTEGKPGKAGSHPDEAGSQPGSVESPPEPKRSREGKAARGRQPGTLRGGHRARQPHDGAGDGRAHGSHEGGAGQARGPHDEDASRTRRPHDGSAALPVRDTKTALQEWLQARGRALPIYRLLDTAGPDHARRFMVEVQVDGQPLGTGESTSKKGAEAQAALGALRRLEGQSTGRRGALEEEGGRLSSGNSARGEKGRSRSRRARGR